MFVEFELRPEQLGTRVDERRAITFEQILRRQLSIPLRQFGLVVEHLEMARRASHEEINDALGLGLEMGMPGRQRIERTWRGETRLLQQLAQRDGAESDAALLEE